MKDLMDYLLGDIIPNMPDSWTREEAETLTDDLLLMGYTTTVDEVYETVDELILQDTEDYAYEQEIP